MQIDLDRPVAATMRRHRWLWLGLLTVAALLVGGALTPRPSAAGRPVSVTREIGFEVEGKGRAGFASVWTRTQVIRYVPSTSAAQYADPVAAVLTVLADPDGRVICRLRVGGVIVDEQVASSGQGATCVWVLATTGLPVVTDS